MPVPKPTFLDALRHHGREVATLEGEQAAEFLRLVRELRERLVGRLSLLSDAEQAMQAWRMTQVLAEAQSAINALESRAGVLWQATAKEAATLAADHLADEVERLSRVVGSKPEVVRIDAAQVLADPGQLLLANHFDSSVKRYGLDVLNGVRRDLFVGMRAGDSLRDVTRQIMSDSGPLGSLGTSNAERLVRTETAQAYGAAQHAGMQQAAKQVPGLVKIWHHTGSYRCDTCIAFHGTSRPMQGTWTIGSGKRARDVLHPPAHPACVCRCLTGKPSWQAAIAKLGYFAEPASRPARK